MAYCTTADVAGQNPQRTYNATSTPTLAQIQEFIDRVAAEIDVVLMGRGQAVPATTPAALVKFLEQLNTLGAGAMTEQAQFPETKGQMSAPAAVVLWKQYREGLTYLKDADQLSTSNGAPLPFSFASENIGNTTEPIETAAWTRPHLGKNKEF